MNRFIKLTLAGSILAAMLWGLGWIVFASTIPAAVSDATTRTDAIVVLTGGRGRIETGVELLRQGLAAKLFVSGAGGRTQLPDLLPESMADTTEIAAAITLGREADDTPGNALETAAWAQRERILSIRLVTAAYHMPRSLLELQTAMPQILIIAHPVFPSNVKADWWRWPGTASLIAREYTKFLLTWIRIQAQDVTASRAKP
jgi:uncharacterized SAM-binding protein YcdF (DUF218 family)